MKISVPIHEIVDLSKKALYNVGVSAEDARTVTDHLLENELSERSSHGFYKIAGTVRAIKESGPVGEITFENETASSVLINGNKNLGLVVTARAVSIMLEKLKTSGLVMIGGHNYAGTTGTMGSFTRRIAESGYIGIMMANTDPCVPAWGSSQPLLGTDPLSVGFPTEGEPIVIDMAASKRSWGDLAIAALEGQQIPEGIVLNKDGGASTDPRDAKYGMLPFGDHKGYCLAMMVELLAGPLVNAKAGKKSFSAEDGFMMLGIKPDIFTPSGQFESRSSDLIDQVRSSNKLPNVDQIQIPGEGSRSKWKINKEKTHIQVVPEVLERIRELAKDE